MRPGTRRNSIVGPLGSESMAHRCLADELARKLDLDCRRHALALRRQRGELVERRKAIADSVLIGIVAAAAGVAAGVGLTLAVVF